MPVALRIKGYRFFFFSLDGNEPLHIHVEQAEGFAKSWLNPVALVKVHGFRSGELSELQKMVEENRDTLLEKWDEHFSR